MEIDINLSKDRGSGGEEGKLVDPFSPNNEKLWWNNLSIFDICGGCINVLNRVFFDRDNCIVFFYICKLLYL